MKKIPARKKKKALTGEARKVPRKRVLITGITGMDGSYLADFLLAKEYEVHGIVRRASTFNRERLSRYLERDPHERKDGVSLHYGDLADASTIRKLIYQIHPEEIYHLAAQSHVRISFDIPEYTANITGLGTLRILEAVKDYEEHTKKKIKFYNAASSEMFGSSPPPQNEKTPFRPCSPYATAKVFSYYTTVNYREAYGIFAVNGILFNHTGPRRGENFVSKKITAGIARIKAGLSKKIYLGNLESKRDWGYAPDYVLAMYLMMQEQKPDDYVIATGETHSVKEFLDEAFAYAGLGSYKKYVEVDTRYYRPTEVDVLQGDASKARKILKWKPKIIFKDLIKIMVDADLRSLSLPAPGEGDAIVKKYFLF